MAPAKSVRCQIAPPLARIVFDRPEVRNAIDRTSIDQFDAALNRIEGDRTLRCVILTGAGDQVFIAGGDLRDFENLRSREEVRAMSLNMQRVLARLEGLDIPVLCALNGNAYGGGCDIVLACDYCIAPKGSVLAFRQTAMGLSPGWGAATRLTRRIGRPRALWILATARSVEAEEALQIGLVQEIVDPTPGRALARAEEIGREIAQNAPLAVAACKRTILLAESMATSDSMQTETDLFTMTWASPDHHRAVRKFLGESSP